MHQRTGPDRWVMRVAVAGGRVAVPSLDAELVVDEIYRASSIG